MTTRNVRSKMKDMNEHINDFESANHSSDNDKAFNRSTPKTSSKGDYIDFEEVK